MRRFDRVVIVGLGLIGGSLGMAIRRRRLARQVVGVSRKPRTLRQARQRGAIDAGTTDAIAAVREADLVILAMPIDAIVPTARRLARACRPGAILMDVGSTKTQIVRALEGRLPSTVAFIGAHPLAGSEQRGVAAGHARLFDDSLCVITRTGRTDRRALQAVKRLWAPLVRRVLVMSPERHDRLLAATSHLPHLVASGLIAATPAESLAVAPRSFLDVTRIAKSDPDLWDDVLLSNRRALLASIVRFDRQWRALRSLITRSQRRPLRRRLAQAKARRDAL